MEMIYSVLFIFCATNIAGEICTFDIVFVNIFTCKKDI